MRQLIVAVVIALPGAAWAQTGVSDDRVSLPEGAGSLEGVGENANIVGNMGLLTRALPMALPEGRMGRAPALGLAYSSSGGSGVCGMGWRLPVSSIERLTVRGLPEYDLSDEFAADGSTQLVWINPDESATAPPVYRARMEGSFIRYTWLDAGTSDEATSGQGGYWLAELPDGERRYYGADQTGTPVESARVGVGGRVFRYLLVDSVDTSGNRTHYEYEKSGEAALPKAVEWAFHDGQPLYRLTFGYEDRPDPQSDCKGGFEELLAERLASVSVYSHGALLRTYHLEYESDETTGGLSRLSRFSYSGASGDEFPVVHSFEYATSGGALAVVTLGEPLGVDFASGNSQLLDINGDALPDVIDTTELGEPHRFYLNQMAPDGSQTMSGAVSSAIGTQSGYDLSSRAVQLLDVDGDGFVDLLNAQLGSALQGLGAGDWSGTLQLWSGGASDGGLPSDFLPADGELDLIRFIDLDGDKRIDVLRSSGSGDLNTTSAYLNRGDGFEALSDGVMPLGVGFDSDAVELNDMNGDSLLDIVQVLQDRVRYRLNLGYGQWTGTPTEWTEISGFAFDTPDDAAAAELEDLNGDAMADIVLVKGTQVDYWLNRNGGSFAPRQTITTADLASGEIPEKAAGTSVFFADMNGNGSSDVVWATSSGQLSFLDLFPVRPHLMTRAENSLGMVTDVTWTTAALEQAAAESPWQYALPFPMPIVKSTTITNTLTGEQQVTALVVADGYYDGVEKDYRGFAATVETVQGGARQESAEMRQLYDVGASDPYRAGLLLESEVRSAGAVLSTMTHSHTDCAVGGLPADQTALRFPVRYVCETAVESVLKERSVDPDDWVTLRSQTAYDVWGNPTWSATEGVVAGCAAECASAGWDGQPCGDLCLGDERYVLTEFASPDDNEAWMLRFPIRQRTYGVADEAGEPATGTYQEALFYYDGEPFEGLPHGQLGRGLLTRRTDRVDGAGTIIESLRVEHDAYGNLVGQLYPTADPSVSDAGLARWHYDASGLFVETAETVLAGESGTYQLVRHITWDTLHSKPESATQWAVEVEGSADAPVDVSYEYDQFGRVTAIYRPGALPGAPSMEMTYELGSPASAITTRRRTTPDGPADLVEVGCIDGTGREYQKRVRIAGDQFQVSGFEVAGVQGNPVALYEPYVADGAACALTPPADVAVTRYDHDGQGRLIRVQLPPLDGESTPVEQRYEYGPLTRTIWDAEDTDPGSPHAGTPAHYVENGLGQLLRREDLLAADGEPVTTDVLWDELGFLAGLVDPEGSVRTQSNDLLGRVVSAEDPDRGLTTWTYDAASDLVRTEDATGRVMRRESDAFGRTTAEWEESDPDGSLVTIRHDIPAECPTSLCTFAAGRQVEVSYPLAGGTGHDWFGYDENGRLVWTRQQMGTLALEWTTTYDHAGRSVSEQLPNGLVFQWTLDGVGRVTGVPGYLDAVTYEPGGSLEELRFFNGVTTSRGYDARGQLATLNTTGPTTDPSDALLLDFAYLRDNEGRITEISDGHPNAGAPTGSMVLAYDSLYRLTAAHLDPDSPLHAELVELTWNRADAIASKTSTNGVSSALHVGAYSYGGAGQPAHGVTSASGLAYGYDAAGRMVLKGDQTLEWDHRGRLSRVLSAGAEVAAYGYAEGTERRIKREEGLTTWYGPNFEVVNGVAVAALMVDGNRVVEVVDPGFVTTVLSDVAPATGSTSALAPAPDGVISAGDAWISQAATTNLVTLGAEVSLSSAQELFEEANRRLLDGSEVRVRAVHRDHLGTTAATTDEAGALISRVISAPFGEVRHRSGDAAGSARFVFTNQERDQAADLVYFGARYLDTRTGRWISPDPAFERLSPDQLERMTEAASGYGYVAGDPVNHLDEDGRFLNLVIGSAVGAVAAASAYTIKTKLRGSMPRKAISIEGGKFALMVFGHALKGAVAGFITSGLSALGEAAGVAGAGVAAAVDTRTGGSNNRAARVLFGSSVARAMTSATYATLSFLSGDVVSAAGSLTNAAVQLFDGVFSLNKGHNTGSALWGMLSASRAGVAVSRLVERGQRALTARKAGFTVKRAEKIHKKRALRLAKMRNASRDRMAAHARSNRL